jgi:hypothetical protein
VLEFAISAELHDPFAGNAHSHSRALRNNDIGFVGSVAHASKEDVGGVRAIAASLRVGSPMTHRLGRVRRAAMARRGRGKPAGRSTRRVGKHSGCGRLASTGETLLGPIKQRWKRSRDDRAWRRCALGQVVRISAVALAAVDAMREHLDGALMMRIDVNPGQRGDLSLC